MTEERDGWMAGWLDGWMTGWLDGWMVVALVRHQRSATPVRNLMLIWLFGNLSAKLTFIPTGFSTTPLLLVVIDRFLYMCFVVELLG